MSNTWYVAPDATTTPGVTVVAIGATGYGTAWNKAAKWSDFNNGAGSIWQTKVASGDTIIFLAGQYKLSAAVGGWSNLNWNITNLSFSGQTVDGKLGIAQFVGSRTFPWPTAGNSGGTVGETMWRITGNIGTSSFSGMAWRSVGFPVTTANNGTVPVLGTINFTDCSVLNAAGCLGYTQTNTDGLLNVTRTRCKMHGYSQGGTRVWGSITDVDVVCDSEFQATANSSNASNTSGANSFDAIPGHSTTTTPVTISRSIYRNNAAGSSIGGNYAQGDGVVCEENVGTFSGKDILTYGNGDRGVDLKCAGTAIRHHSWGDGTAGIAHHMDNLPVNVYQSSFRTGSRPTGASAATSSVQSSGIINLYQSALIANPTSAQTSNNPYSLSKGDVDTSSFQHSIYGSLRQGQVLVNDTWGFYTGSAGATETNGYSGSADPARCAAIFGLTPGTTRHFAIRACAQDGSSSAITSTTAFTLDAASGVGDTTGPAAPTGLTVVGATSGSGTSGSPFVVSSPTNITLSWVPVPQDAGVEIQGHIFRVLMPGDASSIPIMPGKTTTPVTFSGFKPSTTYRISCAAYDGNGNVGTYTSDVYFTTGSGTANTSTPSTPPLATTGNQTGTFIPAGWTNHPTMVGLIWGAPATGTVAYYEIVDTDNSNAVVTRCFPIPSSSTTPTYSKTNAAFASV